MKTHKPVTFDYTYTMTPGSLSRFTLLDTLTLARLEAGVSDAQAKIAAELVQALVDMGGTVTVRVQS
jgi:hypothetical protein